MKLVLASRNPNKLRELRRALPDWDIELLEVGEEPEESGSSFLENARLKARHGREHAEPDIWVAGEDSGIEVAALDGAPGVHSARWTTRWLERLLEELEGVEDRRARYVCELVALAPDGVEVRATGTLEGEIALEPRGSEGFGYDPIFVPLGESRTVAELGNAWKSEHSHRAQAARELAGLLGAKAASVGGRMDVASALERLLRDSAHVERAVVLDADGNVLGSSVQDEGATETLASTARDLAAAAGELHVGSTQVTTIEVELVEGAVFVLREGARTIAAVTGPHPTAGLVLYDLRTCLHGIEETRKPRRRKAAKPKEEQGA